MLPYAHANARQCIRARKHKHPLTSYTGAMFHLVEHVFGLNKFFIHVVPNADPSFPYLLLLEPSTVSPSARTKGALTKAHHLYLD